MHYKVKGNSIAHQKGTFTVKQNMVHFGIHGADKEVPNPAELLLGAFAACCLKNIERFSELLKFEYEQATIEVVGERQEKPTRIIKIDYRIAINSQDASLKLELLHKNIKRYGTIYNTLKETCDISGKLELME